MTHILTFKSESDYQQSRGDLDFWWPHLLDICKPPIIPSRQP